MLPRLLGHRAPDVVAAFARAHDVRPHMTDRVVDPVQRLPQDVIAAVFAWMSDETRDKLAVQVILSSGPPVTLSRINDDRTRNIRPTSMPRQKPDALLVLIVVALCGKQLLLLVADLHSKLLITWL